jgi:hypothetical protein
MRRRAAAGGACWARDRLRPPISSSRSSSVAARTAASLRARMPNTRAMYAFQARQARADVQPWAGMWESGHGGAWQADADYIQAHEAAWAAALLGCR